jgi:hypothetical protein
MTDREAQRQLESLLTRAAHGKLAEIVDFLGYLRDSKVWVAERFQDKPLSDAPEYPNEFFNILGIRDKDRICVPVFTRPELLAQWSGLDLKFRELTFSDLASLIPDEWWVILNPAQETEKEFSPWELQKILEGEGSLNEVAEDLLGHFQDDPIDLSPVSETEFNTLRTGLINSISTLPEIRRINLGKSNLADSEAGNEFQLIVAIYLNQSSEKLQFIRNQCRDLLTLEQITPERSKIFIIEPQDELHAKLFEGLPAIYENVRKPDFFERVRKLFRRDITL